MANQDHNSTASSRRTTPPRQTPNRTSGCGTPSGTGTPRHLANKKPLPVFNSYMSLFQVQEKLKKGEVIEGVLRINPKNYEDAYISAPDGAMDIYIGGVRDRNAALHGDVVMVEIKPHDQWKVLYEQLDEYLENKPHELSIVYKPLEYGISASVSSSAASPYNHMSYKTNYKPALQVKENRIECTNIEGLENLGHLEQCDSDVVVEDNEELEKCDPNTVKVKRKRRGRGKRGRMQKFGDVEVKSHDHVPDSCTPDVEPEFDDSTSCTQDGETKLKGDTPVHDSDDEVKGCAVPPDQLSECDFTDDESGCSEILDYEQAREDEEFIRAQWEAYQEQQREKNGDGGSPVKQELLAVTDGINTLHLNKKNSANEICTQNLNAEMGKGEQSANCVNSVSTGDQEIGVGSAVKIDAMLHNTQSLQGAKKKRKSKKKNKCPKSEHLENNHVPFKGKSKKAKVHEDIECKVLHGVEQHVRSVGKSESKTPVMEKPVSGRKLVKGCSPDTFDTQRTGAKNHRQGSQGDKSIGETPGKTVSGVMMTNQHTPGNGKTREAERVLPSVIQVMRLPVWEKFVQKTAHVVYVVTRKHPRTAAGTLKLFADKNPHLALFSPSDYRIPRLKIPMAQCPPDFMARHQDYLSRIFLAKIVEWNEPKFAFGALVRDIGQVGDIEAETEALLMENDVDYSEFPEAVTKDLPSIPWSIPPKEIKNRTDLRNECIFTIDPSTARDLDDAMSCQPLPSGNFRVGVHIADVSYFIPEESPLDIMASERATSIYLTQKVIPMLPRVLCEHLCSLNPGEDRLAFSVIWELDPKGQVIGEWFGRTVIRSCVKLSYDHAQNMIEDPVKEWSKDELPEITGGYTPLDISKVVNNLHAIAKHLRKKRFDEGALRLDQVKIAFNLDHESGMPNGFFEYIIKDSNRLIEEFMLLANIAVAHKIHNSYPGIAILRRHPPPLEKPMETLQSVLERMDICLDIKSAGALQRSLQLYIGDDKYSLNRIQVIVSLCSKPMQNAKYFCAGMLKDEAFSHYALNVPLYTHFTSPIRRYADVMVHRILAAVVDPSRYQPTVRGQLQLQRITERCNDRKQTGKIVQEVSGELYLSLFIKQVKEMVEEAMVTMVLDHAFDVLVLKMGVIKRVYLDKLPLTFRLTKHEGKSLHLTWNAEGNLPVLEQRISLFSLVSVTLKANDGNALKFNAILRRPP
ncbi:DIS3-like exonuclease 2 isoform X9 [Macrobrachium rosenbergii]